MLSIILAAHNTNQFTTQCLSSILRTARALVASQLEFVLIDDASEPHHRIMELFTEFRQQLSREVRVVILRFKRQQHYTAALAHGLSVATGDILLFISHDMLLTADYVRTLLAVAASDRSIGLVRGTSPHVDGFPQHVVHPPLPIRNFDELESFTRYVCEYWGLQWVEDAMLIGDSMLIKREVIEKIGVFDTRFYGLLGDVDFGLRLQRAGFRMVCAKGAWLWHEGSGAQKVELGQTPQALAAVEQRQQRMIAEAWNVFREKWDRTLPPAYPGLDRIDFPYLRQLPPLTGGENQPALTPDPSICEILVP